MIKLLVIENQPLTLIGIRSAVSAEADIEFVAGAGESAGGFSMHGLARCLCQGYIAGHKAHAETIV